MPRLSASAPELASRLERELKSAGLASESHPLTTQFYQIVARVVLDHIDQTLQRGIRVDELTVNIAGSQVAAGQSVVTTGTAASQAGATTSIGAVTGTGVLIEGVASIA